MKQHPREDYKIIARMVRDKVPFTFVRFSDGELEVIRNEKFFIGDGLISWRKGDFNFRYPEFDRKDFDPIRDEKLRSDLIESAQYKNTNFIKGIPSSHNDAIPDRDLMVSFNGNSIENLTFADLLLNMNFLRFRNEFVPLFKKFENVFMLANHRANPKLINENWELIPIQDNFFTNYENVFHESLQVLAKLPKNALVLASASSLTNILGHRLHELRKDLIFIDVGTSLHDLVGMETGIREYHSLLLPNNIPGMIKKFRLISRSNFRLKW